MKRILYIFVILSFICMKPLFATDYYVSKIGDNTNPGTIEEPFKTIKHASQFLNPGDRCIIRAGVYKETIRPYKSGEPGKNISYSSFNNEKVIISTLEQIEAWQQDNGELFTASMDWSLGNGNQIFADGKMLSEASWPSAGQDSLFNPKRAVVMSSDKNSFVNTDIPGDSGEWIGAKLWCKGGAGWICWTGDVTGFDSNTGTVKFTMPGYSGKWYRPRKGNFFVLKGVISALKDPGEWLYNSEEKKIYLIPPEGKNIEEIVIEAKKRITAINLINRSYITIKGIEFIGGGIKTDDNSSFIILEDLKGRYISHSYEEQDSWDSGIQIYGNNNLVVNCDFGYSSGSILMVKGNDNRIINNYLHHGDYSGLWVGIVDLKGRRQLFSHNTVAFSGRDNITVSELMESMVQYNDISDSGYLTNDLGLIYANSTDFANTVFQYNWLHDNKSQELGMGFHIDIANYNVIVRNNVIWNVPDCPINVNHPSQNAIVYNNSSLNTGEVITFGWFERTRQISARYFNNIFNDEMKVDAYKSNNMIRKKPLYLDPESGDFRLKGKRNKDFGAYANNKLWKPGCDLKNPPNPLPVYTKANTPWMNKIENASFEYGTTEAWIKTGEKVVSLIDGNTWGNNWGSEDLHPTGTNRFELQLGCGENGIKQTIKNLKPNTTYTLSGWVRTSGSNTKVTLGVKDFGGKQIEKSSSSKSWKRKVIKFKTGINYTEITVYISKTKGDGKAWCDNLLLPLTAQ